jgi:hypothetical protein
MLGRKKQLLSFSAKISLAAHSRGDSSAFYRQFIGGLSAAMI